MKIENYKKSNINATEINSNILNYVLLNLDYTGVLSLDAFIGKIQEYLHSKEFEISEGILCENDLEVIRDPNSLSNYLGKEIVYRFYKKESSTSIVVTRFFTYIFLDYKKSHILKEKISIMNNIINIIKDNSNFAVLQQVSLKKSNSILVSSINNIHKCFESRNFNNDALEINRLKNKTITSLQYSKSQTSFMWENIQFNVLKEISEGYITIGNKDKECYDVILDIEGIVDFNKFFNYSNQDYNVKELIEEINSGIFELFKINLSKPFLNDMMLSRKDKIMKGMNSNG